MLSDHLQLYLGSHWCFGLFLPQELMAGMDAGSRYTSLHHRHTRLSTFCSIPCTVTGSKLSPKTTGH
ncbi:hypothetical protein GJAV_G00076670 [Gymnothorax javanicus]|nr:hypothetical protein GJAV_G00076670 [Gymnothorax javanicus]